MSMAMAHTLTLHALLSLMTIFFNLPNQFLVEARSVGFRVELIHRDHSPRSPFYDPSDTHFDHVKKSIKRSSSRIDHFRELLSSTNSMTTNVYPSNGEYLIKLSIGSPPFDVLVLADTGSDLLWTQCKPCTKCYTQKAPIFDSAASSTFKSLPCNASLCTNLTQDACSLGNDCQYNYGYGDHSFTKGILSTDTLTLDSSDGQRISIPSITFGCGHDNEGTFGDTIAGLAGLGGGPLSIISQLSPSIGGKFSYCLVPMTETTASSAMNFGENAIVSGPNVVSTPLLTKSDITYYFVTLEDISIGTKKLGITSDNFQATPSGPGNIFIDTGTPVIVMYKDAFDKLASGLTSAVQYPRAQDPGNFFQVCFSAPSDAGLPDMMFHFTGADLKVTPMHTFVRIDQNVSCLGVVRDPVGSILGNPAMQNIHVGYDLVQKKVYFAPADCTKLQGFFF